MWFKKNIVSIAIALVAVIAINMLSNFVFTRFDMTQDKRYTLSKASKSTIENIDDLITIDVYLAGNLPAEFQRLQIETKQLLEEFTALNSNIVVNYVDPKTLTDDIDQLIGQMSQFGMVPAKVDIRENGKTSQEIVFPWAEIIYNKKGKVVPLLKNNLLTQSTVERVNNSVQHLEYAFANAFKTVIENNAKNIAYLIGNGQLESKYAFDFLNTLSKNYRVTSFTLDSVQIQPNKTLDQLKKFDLAIVAKPTEAFSDSEKYVVDQYIMNGGKSLWLVDKTTAEMDSLFLQQKTLGMPRDLNLKDMFFQYGFRINPVLVKDMYASDIMLNDGKQFNRYPWFYNPLVIPGKHHEIINNINPVKFEFTTNIDLLKQGINIKKTPLLHSSQLTATVGLPKLISLNEISQTVNKEFASKFNKKPQVLAALLEGKFTSTFKNRIKPFKLKKHIDEGNDAKIIVAADGDLVKNQLNKGEPLALGFDKYTGQTYGNKEFLENAVNYLLDDTGLLKVRNKEVKIPQLDVERIASEKRKWQIINMVIPLILLAVFGFVYNYIRKKKYT
ncbi:gliding motility-associated ABC transporter substrate-binding protein GldG [Pseudofulvibacter geojedonensis]|uniref:Gliding motility-associated ABC transporter substrate-binding protein GldG n=1 Tax=Pseudofulvibacter geojedonensis TaxID=1123758 RepID=A0ABW3HYE2_9FLAO